ncbi:transposase [Streptomyces sp. NPDC015127]|uniref:IS110 family transposase n=1 Tax=Streptomyces sp. NPDC015127 TaxID=3364939 RepID=UPI0036F66C3B
MADRRSLLGEARTDGRDTALIAEAARTMPHTQRDLAPDNETVAELSVIVGFMMSSPVRPSVTRTRCAGC